MSSLDTTEQQQASALDLDTEHQLSALEQEQIDNAKVVESLIQNGVTEVVLFAQKEPDTKFTIPVKCVKYLATICAAVSHDLHDNEFSLEVVNKKYLSLIVEYLNFFGTEEGKEPQYPPKPAKRGGMKNNTSEQEAVFIERMWSELSRDDYYELLKCANYLQCTPLVCLLCANVAVKAKDAPSIKHIRSTLLGTEFVDNEVSDDESEEEKMDD